jgi:hypothetical protein
MDATLGAVEGLIEADVERALGELEGRLERGEIGEIGFGEDRDALRADAENNIRNVREAFAVSSKGEVKERVSLVLFVLFGVYGGMSERVWADFVRFIGCAGLSDRWYYL